jgi:ATP-binding cassette subfamily C (CFTR/MRP) protein 1
MIRGSLVSNIYSKTLEADTRAISGAEATTLMSADLERICIGLRDIHEVWASLIELAVALWLLYRQMGLAVLTMTSFSVGK